MQQAISSSHHVIFCASAPLLNISEMQANCLPRRCVSACADWIGDAFPLVSGRFIASARKRKKFGVAGRVKV